MAGRVTRWPGGADVLDRLARPLVIIRCLIPDDHQRAVPVFVCSPTELAGFHLACGGRRRSRTRGRCSRAGRAAGGAGRADRPAVAAPVDDSAHAVSLASLGTVLLTRFEQAGMLADADGAVTALGDALAASPGHCDSARWRSSLGSALQARSVRTGSMADLEDALTAYRDAVAALPAGDPDRAVILFSFGSGLSRRAELTGSSENLRDAVALSGTCCYLPRLALAQEFCSTLVMRRRGSMK